MTCCPAATAQVIQMQDSVRSFLRSNSNFAYMHVNDNRVVEYLSKIMIVLLCIFAISAIDFALKKSTLAKLK